VEKLRDEAQRNGNINWDTGHEIFIGYLRRHLLSAPLFDETARREIETDLGRLSAFEYPETSDAPYDRLSDRVTGADLSIVCALAGSGGRRWGMRCGSWRALHWRPCCRSSASC